MNPGTPCILHARELSLRFPGVLALDNVELCLRAGEVHALLGQNGAGKSTLIRVLTGASAADAGKIALDGRTINPGSPHEAQQLGICAVYQEVNLCPNLSVAENIFAGRYPRRPWLAGGGIDWKAVKAGARAALGSLQIDLDVDSRLGGHPIAIQQMVAIARATSIAARVLILDEPTSSLDDQEVAQLFAVMQRLKAQGIAIVFVTHFLEQVYAVADRMTVLRNGARVGEYLPSELDRSGLIAAMVGRELATRQGTRSDRQQASAAPPGAPTLELTQLARKGGLHPVDLAIGPGEIVGLAGLLGSGRTELARLVFGLDRPDGGTVRIGGAMVNLRGPADAIAHGIAFCPEDRQTEGIVGELSVRENIALALQARRGLTPCLSLPEQEELATRLIAALGITAASAGAPIRHLSGGNQQKALLARWLATQPRLMILDEPTRGIDVAAREDIIRAIEDLAREGMAVLFISAEIAEVVREADRVVVMRERRKVAELAGGCDEQAVYALIAEHA
jgi:simple sugar transport system ATP-binding protein